MSKRQLPEIKQFSAPAGVEFVVAPAARAVYDPRITNAKDDGENTITILAEIGENWDGTGVTPARIDAALRRIGEEPVTVKINSPGGNFFDGLAIYNMLRNHPEKVTVQVLGMAASAASIIAMAGDEIQVAKAGMMMIHNTQWLAIGDRHVMNEVAEQMATFDSTLAQLYTDRTGIEPKAVAKMMDNETFLNGEEAVDKGFADALLPADRVKQDKTKADKSGLFKVDAALAKAGMPRAERRQLLKEVSEDMPGAVQREDVTPRADEIDDTPGAVDFGEGLAALRAAGMRLKLR